MKNIVLFAGLVMAYALLIIPFTSHMRNKPFIEKLGYVPQAEVLRFTAADQRFIVADSLVMKSLFYFGSLVEKSAAKFVAPPDYFSIYKTIETAVKMDPYNIDAYYFAQAVMAWDAKRVREANTLLEYGLKYRDWDYQLPFFLGFNYAYFLKDPTHAAIYYRRAAELSGEPLLMNLAGRYMYESGQTNLALAYLTAMEKSARNEAIRNNFKVRIAAFSEVRKIEMALSHYHNATGAVTATIEELVRRGYLQETPNDPYGGTFFIDEQGQVKSTSKFAFVEKNSAETTR